MSDPDRLVAALAAVFVVALTVWCVRERVREESARIDRALAALTAAVEQARTDIDGIPDVLPELVTYRHPCGLLLIVRRPVDLTDLQRAETPADIWETS